MLCKNKTALVTGGSSGIGRSIALTLAREGARVIINYSKNKENAEALEKHIVQNNGEAISILADVQTETGCKQLVKTGKAKFGAIDICVISPGSAFNPQPIHLLDPEEAINDVANEVRPAFRLMKLVLPDMYDRKWGRIIGMGQHPVKYHPPAFAHNAAKFARASLLKLAAQGDTWKNSVTVNTIAPGPVKVCPSLDDAIEQCNHGNSWKNRDTATGQDIAELAAFLCSGGADFITGAEIPFQFR